MAARRTFPLLLLLPLSACTFTPEAGQALEETAIAEPDGGGMGVAHADAAGAATDATSKDAAASGREEVKADAGVASGRDGDDDEPDGGRPTVARCRAPNALCDVSDNDIRACFTFRLAVSLTVVIADESGYANGGSMLLGARIVRGIRDNALSLSGNEAMAIRNAPSLDITGPITLESWIRPRALPSESQSAALIDGGAKIAMRLQSDGSVSCSALNQTIQGGQVALNTWAHVACVYTGVALKLFVDGELLKTTAATGAMSANTGGFRVGRGDIGVGFDGEIDEVRIINRALADDTICR